MRNLLLINIFGIFGLGARREINFLASSVPVVQVSNAGAKVGRESPTITSQHSFNPPATEQHLQPTQIRSQSPTSNGINLSPDISQVSSDSSQSNDVNSSLNGSLGNEEEWHPDQVETELNCVERGSLFGQEVLVEGGGRCHSGRVCAVGRISHQAIKDGPGGSENVRRWPVWWLVECHVGLLGFPGCQGRCVSWVETMEGVG
jgi:hypothetical protein